MKRMMNLFKWCLIVPLFFVANDTNAKVHPSLKRAIDHTYNAEFDKAEAIFSEYIRRRPGDPLGYIARGTSLDWQQYVFFLRRKNNAKVLADYQKAFKLAFLAWNKDKNNVSKRADLANSYLFLAKKNIDLGKKASAGQMLKKARKHMKFVMEKDPKRYDAYLASGAFNFYAAHVPKGLKFIASILGISGNEKLGLEQLNTAANNSNFLQADALFVLAHAYGSTNKNYEKSNEVLRKMQKLYPNNPRFYFGVVENYMKAKQYAKARDAYQKFRNFCKSKPKNLCPENYFYTGNYHIANGYAFEGQPLKALPYIKEAQEIESRTDFKKYYDAWHIGFVFFLAEAKRASGEIDEAKKLYQQAAAKEDLNGSVGRRAKAALEKL